MGMWIGDSEGGGEDVGGAWVDGSGGGEGIGEIGRLPLGSNGSWIGEKCGDE